MTPDHFKKITLWYKPGKNMMLRHITKKPNFCTLPNKNAYCHHLNNRCAPLLLQCCLR